MHDKLEAPIEDVAAIVALVVHTFWIHRYTTRHQEALVEIGEV